jgi:glycine/serine hydroxymethyltransferase
MVELGGLMARVLGDLANEKTIGEVREAAAALAKRFPLYED